MLRSLFILTAILSLLACSKHQAPTPATSTNMTGAEWQSMSQMSSDQIMAKVKEVGSPGQGHINLQPLVGKWETQTKIWMDPKAAPQISKGKANHEWVLGKRFIKEEYQGEFGGEPFQGMGTIGYDNVKQEYISTWIDSMSTGMMSSQGRFDPSTKSLEMSGKYTCPMLGREMQNRNVTRILNNNMHIFEMYDHTPDGKEFKSLEITYKRKA